MPDGDLTEVYRICAACAPEGFEVSEIHGELKAYRSGTADRLRDEDGDPS